MALGTTARAPRIRISATRSTTPTNVAIGSRTARQSNSGTRRSLIAVENTPRALIPSVAVALWHDALGRFDRGSLPLASGIGCGIHSGGRRFFGSARSHIRHVYRYTK